MPDSLGTLLSASWNAFQKHIQAILIGALIFGVVLALAQAKVQTKTMKTMDEQFGDTERMEELADRIEQGDEAALDEMMIELGMMDSEGQVNEESMEALAKTMMLGTLPYLSMFLLVAGVLSLISGTYYLVLATGKAVSVQGAFAAIPRYILPLLGVGIWSFLRSFAWIPFIGVIPAIIIGPRLLFSGVILMQEGTGIRESVRLSNERTRGYWGKIVGNMIVMGILAWLAVAVLGWALGLLTGGSLLIAAIIAAVLSYVMTGYCSIFITKLANTVMAHPLVFAGAPKPVKPSAKKKS